MGWLLLALSPLLVSCSSSDNQFTVANVGGSAVSQLTVALPWQTLTFKQVNPGDSETQYFEIRRDAHFEYSGRCENGVPIDGSDGYVTNGLSGVSVRLEIACDGQASFTQEVGAT